MSLSGLAGTASRRSDRHESVPFLLKVFYKAGAHHRLDDFATLSEPDSDSQSIEINTWPTCTLRELSHVLAYALPARTLPSPSVGVRLSFRLIYPDPSALRGGGSAQFTSKDLGSVVIGGDGMGRLSENEHNMDDQMQDGPENGSVSPPVTHQPLSGLGGDPDKNLADARFVIGDYLSVAILPPGKNGEVVGVNTARAPPTIPPAGLPGSAGGVSVRGTRSRNLTDEPHGGAGGAGGHYGAIGGHLPRGDWRRGERLPPIESRGHGRGRDNF